MRKILPTLHILVKLGMLLAVLMLVPAAVSFYFHDGAETVFSATGLITFSLCLPVWFFTRSHHHELRPRDGFALVTMLWLAFALIAAMPFYFYFEEMSFTDAFFEAISGLTTTGATIMSGLDTLAPSLNFWRHMLNWLGGMGIIVLAVAVLPMLGVGGTRLFQAEIPGIEKDAKMAPRISQTAKRLWLFYLGCTLLTGLGLHLAGMGWFDAICHAMSAFALGGFSTRDKGIAAFDSAAVEWVIALATLAGGINFATHFKALRHRCLRPYWRDEEVRTLLLLLAASIAATTLYFYFTGRNG